MKIPTDTFENYFISAAVLSVFLIVVITSTSAFEVTCEAGGPYGRNATINVLGNVTDNSAGAVANVTINISTGGTQKANNNLTSESGGQYQTAFITNLDIATYTVAISAKANTTSVYCTDTVSVQLGLNTSCSNRVLRFEGTGIYSSNGNMVTTGNATAGLAEERTANSSTMNSTGEFVVPITVCVKKGSRYTLNLIIDDGQGKRGFLQQIFVAP